MSNVINALAELGFDTAKFTQLRQLELSDREFLILLLGSLASGGGGGVITIADVTGLEDALNAKASSDALADKASNTDLTNGLALKANRSITINTQAGDYTITANDCNGSTIVRMTKGTAGALTVPKNATVAIAVGESVAIRAAGAGQITVTAEDGTVTINTPETLKLRKQGSTVTLVKVGTNEWDLTGDLEPA